MEGSLEMQRYAPGLCAPLIDDRGGVAPAVWTIAHLEDAVARDLESLLNPLAAMPEHLFAACPEASKAVFTDGLIDFAGMCMTSDTNRKKICAAVLLTIELQESRLHGVTATLRQRSSQINRFDFCHFRKAERPGRLRHAACRRRARSGDAAVFDS